jgi:hypothetical protein
VDWQKHSRILDVMFGMRIWQQDVEYLPAVKSCADNPQARFAVAERVAGQGARV